MKLFKFIKNNKTVSLISTLLFGLVSALVISTVSWFVASSNNIFDIRLDSGVVADYFESGDGSQADPFVIARPEHLFNLMYLQQSEKIEPRFYNTEYYFEFGKEVGGTRLFYSYDDNGVLLNENPNTKELNMKYYSSRDMVIPIGSEKYPFIGHLNGHNLTVRDLTVKSNGQADVGIFGYIADGGTVSNAYFENVVIDVGGTVLTNQSSGSHSSVTHASNAYVGYIVGHVHDADASLDNVYVNNCSILNQTNSSVALKNNFGYIGHSDTNNIVPQGTSRNVKLSASSLHSYLENNYSSISGNKFVSRNTEYTNTSSKTVANAITNSSSTYTFGESATTGLGNISLATAGYDIDDSVIRDVRYEDTSNSTFNALSQNATILNSVPSSSDISSFEDGAYLYFDNTKNGTDYSKWQYLVVSTSSSETTKVQMNCYYMTYSIGGTPYWVKYTNGGIVGTTVSPELATEADRPNYYFCLRQSSGSTGISSYSSATDSDTTFHLFSPINNAYVTANTGSSTNSFSLAQTFSSSLEFSQKGNGAGITVATANSLWFYCSGTNIVLRNKVAGFTETYFTFKGVTDPTQISTYAPNYELVTNASSLNANDVVTLVYPDSDSETGFYAIGTQAKNNRNAVEVEVTNKNGTDNYIDADAADDAKLSSFTLGGSSSGWTLRDTYTQEYLYAAGKKATGQNYLRSEATLDSDNYGKWTITIASNNATIKSVGNSYVPYIDYCKGTNNDGDYHIFRAFKSALSKPKIFKRSTNDPIIYNIYDSFTYEVETTSSGVRSTKYYNLFYNNAVSEATYPNALNMQDVTFNLMVSQITFTPQTSGGYFVKVTSAGDITSGGTYCIAGYSSSSYHFMSNHTLSSGKASYTIYSVNNSNKIVDNSSNYLDADDLSDFTFTIESSNSQYTIYSTYLEQFLRGNTNADLGYTATISDNSGKWTIGSGSHGTFRITNVNTTTRALVWREGSTERFAHYATSNISSSSEYYDVELFKYISDSSSLESNAVYIGDQIGDSYDPNYIDIIGQFDSTSTSMTISNSTGTNISSKLGQRFFATENCNKSAVVFVENNHSMDLGRVNVNYSPTSTNGLAVTKGDGALKTVEGDLSVANSGDSTDHSNTIHLSTNNISSFAYCALKIDDHSTPEDTSDDFYTVYAYFDANGTAYVSSGTYNHNEVDVFVLDFRSKTGSVSFTEISYSFTALPGNSGNFGKVGYRSADYSNSTYTDGKWTQTTPTHATDSTILNFFLETNADEYSFVTVLFDGDHTYNISVKATSQTSMYVFNYDAMVYDVYVNGVLLSNGSSTYIIPATAYDFETGWAT